MRIFFVFILCFISTSIYSQIIYWDGGAGTNNWSTDELPSNTERIYILTGDCVSITNSVVDILEITLSGGTTLYIDADSTTD